MSHKTLVRYSESNKHLTINSCNQIDYDQRLVGLRDQHHPDWGLTVSSIVSTLNIILTVSSVGNAGLSRTVASSTLNNMRRNEGSSKIS
jgi:hypothetical protein